jgi:hypothetical protein
MQPLNEKRFEKLIEKHEEKMQEKKRERIEKQHHSNSEEKDRKSGKAINVDQQKGLEKGEKLDHIKGNPNSKLKPDRCG